MRYLFLIIFFSLLLTKCKTSNNHNSSFRSILVVIADKITKSDGVISVDSNWMYKIFNNKYVIYKLPRISMKDSKTKIRGDTIDLELFNPDTTYRYFIVKGDNDIGLEYDNKIKNPKQFSLDSLLRDVEIHPSMFGVYSLKLEKPIKVEQQDGNIFIEKYFEKKLREDDVDSIYRYFDKRLIGINFSFSPLLDKEKKSKLFKSRFINVYYGKDVKDKIIRTEYYGEVKEVKIDNPKFLDNIVEKYEHDIKTIR